MTDTSSRPWTIVNMNGQLDTWTTGHLDNWTMENMNGQLDTWTKHALIEKDKWLQIFNFFVLDLKWRMLKAPPLISSNLHLDEREKLVI